MTHPIVPELLLMVFQGDICVTIHCAVHPVVYFNFLIVFGDFINDGFVCFLAVFCDIVIEENFVVFCFYLIIISSFVCNNIKMFVILDSF